MGRGQLKILVFFVPVLVLFCRWVAFWSSRIQLLWEGTPEDLPSP